MTPYEYQKLAERTEANQWVVRNRIHADDLPAELTTRPIRLLHASIGMQGDLAEVSEVLNPSVYAKLVDMDDTHLIEEIGDMLWYCAEAANAADLSLDYGQARYSWRGPTKAFFDLTNVVGSTSYMIEKWLWYGQPFSAEAYRDNLGNILSVLYAFCHWIGVTPEGAMKRNIAKLRKRFPEKYSDEKALEANRDREAERKILETETAKERLADSGIPAIPDENDESPENPGDSLESTIPDDPPSTRKPEETSENSPSVAPKRSSSTLYPGSARGLLINGFGALFCEKCKTPISDGMIDRLQRREVDSTFCPECELEIKLW